jgi:hypothetical protein
MQPSETFYYDDEKLTARIRHTRRVIKGLLIALAVITLLFAASGYLLFTYLHKHP